MQGFRPSQHWLLYVELEVRERKDEQPALELGKQLSKELSLHHRDCARFRRDVISDSKSGIQCRSPHEQTEVSMLS